VSEPDLGTFLRSQASVTALTGQRIYGEQLPQAERGRPQMPAVVFRVIAILRERLMCHTDHTMPATFQVDCFALSRDERNRVADAIRLAMVDYCGLMGAVPVCDVQAAGEMDLGPEQEPGLYRRMLTFTVWYQE
jgi:hypothetical protein